MKEFRIFITGGLIITILMIVLALLPDFNILNIHCHTWIAITDVVLIIGWLIFCLITKRIKI